MSKRSSFARFRVDGCVRNTDGKEGFFFQRKKVLEFLQTEIQLLEHIPDIKTTICIMLNDENIHYN